MHVPNVLTTDRTIVRVTLNKELNFISQTLQCYEFSHGHLKL